MMKVYIYTSIVLITFFMIKTSNSTTIRLRSWKNDYLTADQDGNVISTKRKSRSNEWEVIVNGGKLSLKNVATGLFLHRPDQDQGVTTWCCGIGNNWEVEGSTNLNSIQLKSWKNDYLHRPDGDGITTWHTGKGNEWNPEVVSGAANLLLSLGK